MIKWSFAKGVILEIRQQAEPVHKEAHCGGLLGGLLGALLGRIFFLAGIYAVAQAFDRREAGSSTFLFLTTLLFGGFLLLLGVALSNHRKDTTGSGESMRECRACRGTGTLHFPEYSTSCYYCGGNGWTL